MFLTFPFHTLAANLPPSSPLIKGGRLPVINLPVPKSPNEKTYLGVTGKGYFKIPQIKAEAVILIIFNLYCPTCQNTASEMNELFHTIENYSELKGKIKLIGIGVGNSLYEVEVFKETYNITFPVFPDKDFYIHKALGEVRTPFFIVVKIQTKSNHQVVYTQLGGLTDAGSFLNLTIKACGLKHEALPSKGEEFAISITDWPQ